MRGRAIGGVERRPDIATLRRRTTQAMVVVAALLCGLIGWGLFRLTALVLATVIGWFGPMRPVAAAVNGLFGLG